MKKLGSLLCGTLLMYAAILVASPSAMSQPLPRGAVPPENLNSLVRNQQEVSRVVNALLRALPVAAPPPPCTSATAKFDWRTLSKVSPVQQQGSCGSCWAFASIAAFESAYMIANTGNPSSSEQQALDCASPLYTCVGGWHDKVLEYHVSPGNGTKASYPYTAVQQQCKPAAQHTLFASNWNYVAGASIPNDSAIKDAICRYGPVVGAVDSGGWDERLPGSPVFKYSTQNPNFKSAFPNGVFKGKATKTGLTMDNFMKGDVDHDIVIVGWDDADGAWIIKNSWGTSWGDGGFMKLKYGTANLGFNAAWVTARVLPPGVAADPATTEILNAIQSVSKNLKVQ